MRDAHSCREACRDKPSAPANPGVPEQRMAACRAMIEERRRVGALFGFTLCAAPAWDMLLDLYLAEGEGRSTYLWALCLSANIPMSTAHRKVGELAAAGLVEQSRDEADRRRVSVSLSTACAASLDALMDWRADGAVAVRPIRP